jgi:formylglycine-generating enzyme required for sulfatase activity
MKSRTRKSLTIIALLILVIFSGNSYAQSKKNPQIYPIPEKPWDIQLSTNNALPMVWVSPGKFVMGSPESEPGRKADESPQTTVTLTRGYWLGNTEVTVGQWKAVTGIGLRDKVIKMLNDESLYDFEGKKLRIRDFMGFDKNDPDKIMANEDNRLPMYFVSWNEAMDFCRKLNQQERAHRRLPAGYEYTLPTEAQWEFACRAGTTGPAFTDNLDSIAWYVKNSASGYTGKGFGNPPAGPRKVGGKLPNQLGLQDMPGNLWEWCRDWYGPYPGGNITDPLGPASGIDRVNRGGSFGSGANDERSANRAKNPPNEDSAYRGFRVALCAVHQ